MTFQIRLANICMRVSSVTDEVYIQCRDYLDEKSLPEFTIELRRVDVEEEALHNGISVIESEQDFVKYEKLALYRKIAENLIERDILLIHGSVVAVKNKCVLFTAPSGTGKTTHTQLWIKQIPNSYIVNGDKPLISIKDKAFACGTPWAGKERYQRNCKVPLVAVVFLHRGENNSIHVIAQSEVVPRLLHQVYIPYSGELLEKTMILVGHMAKVIPFFDMECNNFKDDAVATALSALGPLLKM